MKLIYRENDLINPLPVLRKAGYSHFTDPKTKKESYVLRTGPDYYPRFHLYIVQRNDEKTELDLHLDQKKPQYAGAHAHNAEYDGPTVEKEMRRIAQWVLKERRSYPLNTHQVLQAPEPKPSEDRQTSPKQFGGIF